jgi:ABC-type transport system involved in multi-copper enzyme maturation permease subunit
MIKTIIKKEILENLLSFKFSIVTIFSVILIFTSVFIMHRDYQLRVENYEILQPQPRQPIAIIPPTPLSIFAKGLDETMGRSYEIRFGGQIRVGSKQQSINTLFRLFTAPDLLYIIKVVLSLCAMLFAFNLISGEKEAGTLKLSLSNTIGRAYIIIGKWAGGFSSFMVPFLITLLVSIILVTLSPQVQMNSENWVKLILFSVSSILYLAIFFSLGVFISCITHRTASSLVISLFAWALIVFVIPNLGNILAKQLVTIPTVQQLEVKRDHIWIKEVFELNNEMTQNTSQKSRSESFSKRLNNINYENDKLIADYRTRFNGLVTLSKNISRISPSATFTYLATDLAGTGILEEQRLKQALLQYKNTIWDKPVDSDGNLKGEFSPFNFKRSSITSVLANGGISNGMILILFNLLVFSATYVAFLRYDVR